MGSKSSEKTIWELAIEERNNDQEELAKQALSGNQDVSSPHGDESSVFVIGSKNAGKTSVILRFLDRDEAPKSTTALDYTFGRKAKGHNIAKDVGHIWELGGGTFLSKLIDIPISQQSIRTLSVAIVLDLSLPNELWVTMETLLSQVKSRVNKVLEELARKNPGVVNEMKKNAWKKFGDDHPDKSLVEPFPIPLAIIGGKYDIYQDFDPEKRKMISRTLRFIAHSHGAHLQFFSTKSESLTGRVRGLMGHLLFHTSLSKSVSVDHNKPIIVPAGLDTLSQIGAPPVASEDLSRLQSRSPYDLWKAAYATFFPPEKYVQRNTGEDPSKDPQFYEPAVDSMRKQKDEELERYRKIAERKAREVLATTGGKTKRVQKQ
ncbi:cytoplasmic dynein 2 light intermediate chain 1-like [Actinia tenebrosa]|uniref:Cytoplasmic dynein 2 light intermediate chain 1 n=1 Tax=Actinia tenebrosa TaxID=6105 RepID=A0A6P8HIB8_ACTTE|nr:cytoplasmic dynein 2 light intermediate chain 1-like [Actinia tenebrosa]